LRRSLNYFTLNSWTNQDRRKIEHEAFSGQLLGIIATNALELGIDIGVLDAVIMLGFPMTVSNFVRCPFS
jgi:DEAD/DEAH box helicase domain-containing protein